MTNMKLLEQFSLIDETIERYKKNAKNQSMGRNSVEEEIQHLKDESADLYKQIELLEDRKRKMLGERLDCCSLSELDELEIQMDKSLRNVRATKNIVYKEQIHQLKEQEKNLEIENSQLRKEWEMIPLQLSVLPTVQPPTVQPQEQTTEVETALFIGLSKTQTTKI